MGAYRDGQMLEVMYADTVGYRAGISTERHRTAQFLGVTEDVLEGIGLIDEEKRIESLKAIIAGAELKIREVSEV